MSSPATDVNNFCSSNEDGSSSCEDKEKQLSNLNSHNSQDCIEERVTDLTRDFEAFKQATESQLEELEKHKAEAEKKIEELREELQQTIERQSEELKELRALVEEITNRLRREFAEDAKEAPRLQDSLQSLNEGHVELEDRRASTDHEKRVDNTKRSLSRTFSGIFFKKNKKQAAPEKKVKKKDAKAEEIGTDKRTSIRNSSGQRKSSEASQIRSFVSPLPTQQQDAYFQFPAVNADIKAEEIGTSRRRSSGGASQINVGIAIPYRYGSVKSLQINSFFADENEAARDELEGIPFYRPFVWRRSRSFPAEFQDLRDEVFEPLQINIHPAFQEQEEGAKVKFECMVQGKEKVCYQWFKDDMRMPKQNSSTFALDSVKLCDFGRYTCEVMYACSARGNVTYAMLDITPRDGMRYKCLVELDPYTEDKVANLLTRKTIGLRGWKWIAYKYNMEKAHIEHLDGNPEAGKTTMTWLSATKPDLTVYEFCKTLKKYNIKRFDIVKELLDHLAVSKT